MDDCNSFLALAIRDPDGIVGVICLANKETVVTSDNSANDSIIADDSNSAFTDNDERFVEAFAVFCGMAIRNAADYEVRHFVIFNLSRKLSIHELQNSKSIKVHICIEN